MSRLIGHFTSFYITYSASFRSQMRRDSLTVTSSRTNAGSSEFWCLVRASSINFLHSSSRHQLATLAHETSMTIDKTWSRIQGSNTGNAGNLSAIDDFGFKSVTEYQGTDFIKRQRIGMLLLSQWAAGLLSEQMSRTPLRVSIFSYWCERDQRAECREQWAESF